MGVGDRHSKRAAAEKLKAQGSIQQAFVADDRELDDSFSAWGDDDAGAHKPELAESATSSEARTNIGHKAQPPPPRSRARAAPPAVTAQGTGPRPGPSDALVDPVAMRDIVISRSRTLDDPLTTRVLAEIARSEALNDRGRRGPLPQRTRTRPEAVKVAPPKILAAAAEAVASSRAGERTPERSPDTIAVERQETPWAYTSDEIIVPRGPLRGGLPRDAPFRKK